MINGLTFDIVYALIALRYTIVYGVIGVVNCAYCENPIDVIARMVQALDDLDIEGVKTTTPLHKCLLASPVFKTGRISNRRPLIG